MIFIVVKFPVKPEYTDRWLELVGPFTEATRAEPGNLWFDWARSVEDPNGFVLVEAFQDGTAEAHVTSEHFKAAMAELPAYLVATPDIVSTTIDGAAGWSKLGEMTVPG